MSTTEDTSAPATAAEVAELAAEAWHHADNANSILHRLKAGVEALRGLATALHHHGHKDEAGGLSFVADAFERVTDSALEELDHCMKNIRAAQDQAEALPEPPEPEGPPESLADAVARCGTSDAPMPLWRDGKRKVRP
jgi:hypothetical protein